MRVLVCGGRDFNYSEPVYELLDKLDRERGIDALIHGGATGADRLAEHWGILRGVEVNGYLPEWKKHGKAAGPIRNRRMIRDGKPDIVVAFPGGRGTADMVRQARTAGIEVIEAPRSQGGGE